MDKTELVSIGDFCQYYQVEVSFIQSLEDSGLIEIQLVDEEEFIPFDEMSRVEKFMRMHYDLDINLAGLETIDRLLGKIETLQRELRKLQDQTTGF